MTVSDLINKLDLKLIAGADGLDHTISGCYICDLLSLVMSNSSSGNVWVTVQTNINVIAVAALTDAACVVIAENSQLEPIAISKADKEGIAVLSTHMTAYEIACKLKDIL